MDTCSSNLVNVGRRFRDTVRRHASVIHWCTCLFLFFSFLAMLNDILIPDNTNFTVCSRKMLLSYRDVIETRIKRITTIDDKNTGT